jgi:membrane associated rhomboid family serine protease
MGFWSDIKYQFNKGDSGIRRLIFINVAAFLVAILFRTAYAFSGQPSDGTLLQFLYLNKNLAYTLIRPWSLVTNIFMHAGLWHLLGNMLWLFFIGTVYQDFTNNKRVYTTFVGGGLVGGIAFLLVYNLAPIFRGQEAYLLGASGGVTAVIIAAAVLLPYYEFRPFGLFSIQLRYIALFRLITDFVSLPELVNTGGTIAHLGGALFGYLYMKNVKGEMHIPTFNTKWPDWFRKKAKMKVDERAYYSKKTQNSPSAAGRPNQDEIDAILDKISQSGYASLTAEEKDKLFKASQ